MTTTPLTLAYDDLTLGAEVGFSNPRKTTGLDAKSIGELAADIEENGLTDPIHIWTTDALGSVHHVVLRGQRRYLAIGKLIRDSKGQHPLAENVPVLVVTQCQSVLDAEVYAARELAHGQAISTYELADYMAHLRARGMSGKDVAQRLGRSETWVSRISHAYNRATPELREAWAKGKVPDDAVKMLAEVDAEAQPEAVAEFLEAREAGGRRARAEAKAKVAEKAEAAEVKKKTKSRSNAKSLEDMHETLEAMASQHPVVVGMRALAKWALGGLSTEKLPKEFHQALKKHEVEEAKRLSVGDLVAWKSQAGGHWTSKKGTVIEVVPADKQSKKADSTAKRQHESYVVETEDGAVYWPVVSQLKSLREG